MLSTSRRAEDTATSGVASEQPKLIEMGLPPAVALVTCASGACPCAVPPASCTSAYLAPEKDSFSNVANGPPHVVRIPILMAPAGAEALLTPVADGLVPEDVVLLLLLHAAAAKARAVRTSVILNRPGADLPWFLIFHLFLLGRSSSRAAATRPPRPEPGPRRRIIMELNNRFPMIDVIWRCTRPSSSSERLTTVT